jgi:hypothetical protein
MQKGANNYNRETMRYLHGLKHLIDLENNTFLNTQTIYLMKKNTETIYLIDQLPTINQSFDIFDGSRIF